MPILLALEWCPLRMNTLNRILLSKRESSSSPNVSLWVVIFFKFVDYVLYWHWTLLTFVFFLFTASLERMSSQGWLVWLCLLPICAALYFNVKKSHSFEIVVCNLIVIKASGKSLVILWRLVIEETSMWCSVLSICHFWRVIEHAHCDSIWHNRLTAFSSVWLLRLLKILQYNVGWSLGIWTLGAITIARDSIWNDTVSIPNPAPTCFLADL